MSPNYMMTGEIDSGYYIVRVSKVIQLIMAQQVIPISIGNESSTA
jgi:hypothetical protein